MAEPDELSAPVDDIEARLEAAVAARAGSDIDEILGAVPSSEALRLVLNMSEDQRDIVLALVDVETAAELVEEAPEATAGDLFEGMAADRAALVLEVLDSDVQVDVLAELDDANAEAILAKLDPAEADDIRALSLYDPNTAGGLMATEVFAFDAEMTVGHVLRALTGEDEDQDLYRSQHAYMVDGERRLVGVVSLRSLLSEKRSKPLHQIMDVPQSVQPDAPLDVLEDLFDEKPFRSIPVTDAAGILIGVVLRDSISAATLEKTEIESLARQGVIGDELRSMPLMFRSRRRLSWLSGNIVLNIIAASVISAYEETLTAVIAIAVFLPMVSDMSGCSGNQAVGVSMRELALGLARPMDIFRVLRKEVLVGLINGFVLGTLIGIVAWVWKGNPVLGLVIGLALALNTVVAVSIGGTVPLALKRYGIDPAVASGPLLTTITDMVGFFLVLSLATVFMPALIS